MRNRLFSKLILYSKLLRIKSWVKNFFVFVPLIFSKQLLFKSEFITVLIGFLIFSLASSVIYIFNDIKDIPKDSVHPIKKLRPLANGSISIPLAKKVAYLILTLIFILTFYIDLPFMLVVWGYIVLNILYTAYLKNIVLIDIFCISLGFMLRVIGGALIISVNISSWLILTTLFLSLFLAVMKRRVEIASSENALLQRSVLGEYSLAFIDQISSITAGGVIISYALYTVADRTIIMFGSEYFVVTTIFVIFGIFRYMYLGHIKKVGENVVDALTTDWPMVINLILYITSILIIIYLREYV